MHSKIFFACMDTYTVEVESKAKLVSCLESKAHQQVYHMEVCEVIIRIATTSEDLMSSSISDVVSIESVYAIPILGISVFL